MDKTPEPIAVIGTGYVGLVTAAGFAELGSEVWCVDVDADKIERLQRGEVPIYEPGLEELVVRHRDRLHFSTELAPALEHARLLFVAVGTPPTYSGDADLSAVNAVVDAMPPSDRHALVMKSTVPVGTGAAIQRRFVAQGKEGFRYVSCPEFLKEGTAVNDFLHPDRVVVGDEQDWAGDAVAALYEPLGAPIVRTDIASAEMVKLASNAFLATKISFINEIANVCEETGADVKEVARGMGLDDRIGPKFLQAGIGYGGSCLVGEETVLARLEGRTTLLTFEELWRRVEAGGAEELDGMLEPVDHLEVLSWRPGEAGPPQFLPVIALFRREYEGELIELRTKMGRRLRCTPDHPIIVSDGEGGEPEIKLAGEVDTRDWVPLAMGSPWRGDHGGVAPVIVAAESAGLGPHEVRVRPPRTQIQEVLERPLAERREIFEHPRGAAERWGDVKRTGVMSLAELGRAGLALEPSPIRTARGTGYVTSAAPLDTHFWRVVGLYLAEGCVDGGDQSPYGLVWSFHPHSEEHLVDEVSSYLVRVGLSPRAYRTPTSRKVCVHSRLFATWWMRILGLGGNCYTQRLPDWIWDRSPADKWALLSGLWEGDGSWSLVNGGPSVILEFGTVSDELADGVMRLLGDVGIVCSRRVGRVEKSTKDTHWLRISGAGQIERAIELVPVRDRPGVLASIARQAKRIAPTGSRRFGRGPAWLRVASMLRQEFAGHVYSMEVCYAHTFVASGGLVAKNCFPKDVSALKQLAGNSGYHFQLLNAVIEVNELQKRRVIGKLQKHLGSLVGKTVALLGLSFKPDTDDMREASSLVLAARLQADGAVVKAFDPVAENAARALMPALDFADSALEAIQGADAVVLVTEWGEFRELDWNEAAKIMSGTLVVDGRNALDDEAVRSAGLSYEGVGRR